MFPHKLSYVLFVILIANACVPAKKLADLEEEFKSLQEEHQDLSEELNDCKDAQEEGVASLEEIEEKYQTALAEKKQLEEEHELLSNKHDNLEQSYNALEENSSSALTENSKRNRELLATLEEKEKTIAEEQSRLEQLEKELDARAKRVDELESVIAAKDAKMQELKNNISNALTDFEGKGLSVEQRNGKVYVSMENKLLFGSGSWAVGTQGKKAVNQLGKVLAENPDINVLIEGHTDDVPYSGNGSLQDNWDLSTKRATAIVRILRKNSQIDPKRLTAAGKGEYLPVATNNTTEGKAKNRRIEVVLTPKLDEISELLQEL